MVIDSALSGPGVVNATAAGGIWLSEAAGNLALSGVASAGGATVRLNAAGAILDGRSGTTPAANVRTTGRAVLTAGSGIGASGAAVQADVASVQANSGTGDLFLDNLSADLTVPADGPFGLVGPRIWLKTAGGLYLPGTISASGPVTVNAGGGVTVLGALNTTSSIELNAGGDLTVLPGATLQAGASMTLSAGGTITLQSGSRVATPNGVLGLTSDVLNVLGAVVANTGYASVVEAANFLQVPQVSAMNVSASGQTPSLNASLSVFGTDGDDTYNLSATQLTVAGRGTFQYRNFPYLFVSSGAGHDTFNVTGTSASVRTRLQSLTGTLNLSTNGSANAPLFYEGANAVNVMADYHTGAPFPNTLTVSGAGVQGLGLNVGFNGARAINVTLTGAPVNLTVPDSGAPVTARLSAGSNLTLGTGDLGTFGSSVDVTGVAGSGNSLLLDNGKATGVNGTLTAGAATGFAAGPIRFSGLDAMTLDAGNGTVNVLGTIAGPVTINTGYRPDDPLAPNNTVRVVASASSLLTVKSTGTADRIAFDASGRSAPVNATLADGATGSTRLTGFGDVGAVTFSGFAAADLTGGSGNDTMTLSSTVARCSSRRTAGPGTTPS